MRTELLGLEKLPELANDEKERLGSLGILDKPKNLMEAGPHNWPQMHAAMQHHQQLAAAAAAAAAASGNRNHPVSPFYAHFRSILVSFSVLGRSSGIVFGRRRCSTFCHGTWTDSYFWTF